MRRLALFTLGSIYVLVAVAGLTTLGCAGSTPQAGELERDGSVAALRDAAPIADDSALNTPDPPLACALPWGGTISHGQSVSAYQQATALSPTLCSQLLETRVCQNGVLSGSYTQPSCTQQHQECDVPGYGKLLHGQQLPSYQAASVPCGQSCTQVTLSCVDGALQGGSYVASCQAECSCTFGTAIGFVKLAPGTSCTATVRQAHTTAGCSGGAQTYASFSCTYSCDANGNLTRSAGGPCEMGNGPCGGSASKTSTSNCPGY